MILDSQRNEGFRIMINIFELYVSVDRIWHGFTELREDDIWKKYWSALHFEPWDVGQLKDMNKKYGIHQCTRMLYPEKGRWALMSVSGY